MRVLALAALVAVLLVGCAPRAAPEAVEVTRPVIVPTPTVP